MNKCRFITIAFSSITCPIIITCDILWLLWLLLAPLLLPQQLSNSLPAWTGSGTTVMLWDPSAFWEVPPMDIPVHESRAQQQISAQTMLSYEQYAYYMIFQEKKIVISIPSLGSFYSYGSNARPHDEHRKSAKTVSCRTINYPCWWWMTNPDPQ